MLTQGSSVVTTESTKKADETKSTNIALKAEKVLLSPSTPGIHEGQVSFTHGFVPHQPLMDQLPEAFKAWDDFSSRLPEVIAQATERLEIVKLPLLDASNPETLPNEYLARAGAILANAAHAYYFNQRKGLDQKKDPLPECIKKPWEQINKRLGRNFDPTNHCEIQAYRSWYDVFLNNWKLVCKDKVINGENNANITGYDLALQTPVFGSSVEIGNNLTPALAELHFAPALKQMLLAIKAVAKKDDDALIAALAKITRVIEQVTETLDWICPNEHSTHYVDQVVWTKTIAKFDGSIPGGHQGLSGNEFPMFHALDSFFERQRFDSSFGKAFANKFQLHPNQVNAFISALQSDLSDHSIRSYVEQSKNPLLTRQYQGMLEAYIGHRGFMDVHKMKMLGFIKINFSAGRNSTNGGNTGSSLGNSETQRTMYDQFDKADMERSGNFKTVPYYAKKVSVRHFGDKAAEVILDVSGTGFEFQPGDRCMVLPHNSQELVKELLNEYKLDPNVDVKLNDTWKALYSFLGQNIDSIKLGELLKYVDARSLQKERSQVSPENAGQINIEKLIPLSTREYSVSPVVEKPNQIRFTVGKHSYKHNDHIFHGAASGHLIDCDEPFIIRKVVARNFHLPNDPKTPIIMFAAGTGIAPFKGMIDARKEQKDSGANLLLFSTPNKEAYYYRDELQNAAKEGELDLSVIFSREESLDTVVYDEESKSFTDAKKYKGKHIDELVKANAKKIADLITSGAHVYVCGNSGFSDTVRKAVEDALKQHAPALKPHNYIDTLIADFRYKADVFTEDRLGAAPSPKIYRSTVAAHNKIDDCWVVINGSVYDMTKFQHIHPGGRKIIHVRAGSDATGDYNKIGHNQDQQVEALLAQYKVGEIATPEFSKPVLTATYKQWTQYLALITEMQDTLSNNTEFYTSHPAGFLWREVFSVLFDGELASTSTRSGAIGPFKHVFGKLLDDLCTENGLAKSDFLGSLHKKASEVGMYLRGASVGLEKEDDRKNIESIYLLLLARTTKLIAKIRELTAKVVEEMDGKLDQFDLQTLQPVVKEMGKEIESYYDNVLDHTHQMLGLRTQNISMDTVFSAPLAMCPVIRRPETENNKEVKVEAVVAAATTTPTAKKAEATQGQHSVTLFKPKKKKTKPASRSMSNDAMADSAFGHFARRRHG